MLYKCSYWPHGASVPDRRGGGLLPLIEAVRHGQGRLSLSTLINTPQASMASTARTSVKNTDNMTQFNNNTLWRIIQTLCHISNTLLPEEIKTPWIVYTPYPSTQPVLNIDFIYSIIFPKINDITREPLVCLMKLLITLRHGINTMNHMSSQTSITHRSWWSYIYWVLLFYLDH